MIANLVFLRLRDAELSQPVEACVTDAAGEVVFSGLRPLDELGHFAEGRRVIASVPGRESLFLRAVLPPMPRRQIAKALPYAIEDRLVDELASLHLATGTAQSSDTGLIVPVEVIARERLEAICTRLAQSALRPSALYVDAAVLGDGVEACAWIDGEEVHLRTANGERSSLSRSAWESWQRTGPTESPATLVTPPTDDPAWLPRQLLARDPINLLQGEFAARAASDATLWRRWRAAAAVAVAVVLLQVFIVLLAQHDARTREAQLDAELLALAQPALPIGGDAVDALALIRNAVSGKESPAVDLTGSAGLEVLSLLAQGAVPLELSAIAGETRLVELSFARLAPEDAATLQDSLRASGWTVESLAPSGAAIRWRLTRGGAP